MMVNSSGQNRLRCQEAGRPHAMHGDVADDFSAVGLGAGRDGDFDLDEWRQSRRQERQVRLHAAMMGRKELAEMQDLHVVATAGGRRPAARVRASSNAAVQLDGWSMDVMNIRARSPMSRLAPR